MTRAVLQGVGFAFRDCQLALQTAGTTLTQATAIGGGAKSDYWLQLIANTLNISLNIPTAGDYGASLGAARLGMIAAEQASASVVCIAPETQYTIEPEGNFSQWIELHEKYQSTYRSLAPVMSQTT